MYPPSEYQKFSSQTSPTAPPAGYDNTAVTGIPVSGTDQFYSNSVPTSLQIQSKPPVPWNSGLCDCCDDVPNCCLTFWCPCVTFGRIAEIIDRGSTSCPTAGAIYTLIMCVTGCSCLYTCFYRSKLRNQYTLEDEPCNDCLVHCCCEYCALCQEYRELKTRGFDVPIGWQGNIEKQSLGIANLPPASQGPMTR